MPFYKAPNKRIIMRGSDGKFRITTLKDFGFKEASDIFYICVCGYGEDESWHPLLETGICPKCGSKEKDFEKMRERFAEGFNNDVQKLNTEELQIFYYLETILHNPMIDPRELSNYREKLISFCNLQLGKYLKYYLKRFHPFK